jgi:hypothetical protein
MGIHPTKILSILLLVLIAGIPSCSKEEKSIPASQQKRGNLINFVRLSARILPENPTAANDLQVVFTGTGNVKYQWDKNGQPIEGQNGPALPRKLFNRGDRITIHIVANGQQDSASLTIQNSPPNVTTVSFDPENICRGVDINAAPTSYDADGDLIKYSYKWIINGEESFDDTPVLGGNRFKAGDRIALRVIPSDDFGPGKEYVTQSTAIPNCPPYFVSTPPNSFEGNRYTYEVKARDPDGGPVSYSLVAAPQGMTIDNNTGRIEWTVLKQNRSYDIDIEAKDNEGLVTHQRYTLNINLL